MGEGIHFFGELAVLVDRRGEIVEKASHSVFSEEIQTRQVFGKSREIMEDMVTGGREVPVACLPEGKAELPLAKVVSCPLVHLAQQAHTRSNGFSLPCQVGMEEIGWHGGIGVESVHL